ALAPLEHRQAQLEHRLLALGLIALVAAGVGVWLAADLVLRPLRRLRTVASSVAEDEDLDRRVPPGGPSELRSLAASFNAMLARLGRSAADRTRAPPGDDRRCPCRAAAPRRAPRRPAGAGAWRRRAARVHRGRSRRGRRRRCRRRRRAPPGARPQRAR